MRKYFWPLLLSAVAGCTPQSAAPVPPVAPADVQCLALDQVARAQVLSDDVISFTTQKGQRFDSHLPAACAGLAAAGQFTFAPDHVRLCAGDSVTVVATTPQPSLGAACPLGRFTPIPAG